MEQPILINSLNIILISLLILTLPTEMAEQEISVFDSKGINLISDKLYSLWYTAFYLGFYFLVCFQTSVHGFNHCFYISAHTKVWTLGISWEMKEALKAEASHIFLENQCEEEMSRKSQAN